MLTPTYGIPLSINVLNPLKVFRISPCTISELVFSDLLGNLNWKTYKELLVSSNIIASIPKSSAPSIIASDIC